MLIIDERVAATIQPPETDKKVLFNDAADGLLKTKDSAGVLETLATTEALAAAALATEPKVYVALLTQTGTNAPVATVLKNTLGGTVVWSRISGGSYRGTLAGVFIANKTIAFTSGGSTSDVVLNFGREGVNSFAISVLSGGDQNDDFLVDGSLRIEVYP